MLRKIPIFSQYNVHHSLEWPDDRRSMSCLLEVTKFAVQEEPSCECFQRRRNKQLRRENPVYFSNFCDPQDLGRMFPGQ